MGGCGGGVGGGGGWEGPRASGKSFSGERGLALQTGGGFMENSGQQRC